MPRICKQQKRKGVDEGDSGYDKQILSVKRIQKRIRKVLIKLFTYRKERSGLRQAEGMKFDVLNREKVNRVELFQLSEKKVLADERIEGEIRQSSLVF